MKKKKTKKLKILKEATNSLEHLNYQYIKVTYASTIFVKSFEIGNCLLKGSIK